MVTVADSAALGLLRGPWHRAAGRRRALRVARDALGAGAQSVPAGRAIVPPRRLASRHRGLPPSHRAGYRVRARLLPSGWRGRLVRRRWRHGEQRQLYLRAGALNRGLSPRESLLVVAESLSAAVVFSRDDPGTWRRLTRQRDLLETAVRLYPADPRSGPRSRTYGITSTSDRTLRRTRRRGPPSRRCARLDFGVRPPHCHESSWHSDRKVPPSLAA